MADRTTDTSAGGAAPASAAVDLDWSWPPYAPVPAPAAEQFRTEEWAPASTVRHPWVRVGRWTLLYRRAA